MGQCKTWTASCLHGSISSSWHQLTPPLPRVQYVNVTTGENVAVQELQAANAAKPIQLPGPECTLQGRC